MEACVRGFSFMPENNVNVIELQYIESGELERTWKERRRHRVKEQEQKIWEEFVKETDVAGAAFKEDPYQFLSDLPEGYLKDLMETELNRMKKENQEESNDVEEQSQQMQEAPQTDRSGHVTFDECQDAADVFHIFSEDNNDDQCDVTGEEEDPGDSPRSPSTVRERTDEDNQLPTAEKESGKCTEEVASMVESSIYCARVKDLRLKINDQLLAIISSLESQDLSCVEREEASRRSRRGAEFAARFNRVHLYQIQRQMHDLRRHASHALPFARHTHFQALMTRVVSLHQNTLQALQVFHKCIEQSWSSAEWCAALRAALAAARVLSALCGALPAPAGLAALTTLYHDEVESSCDKLDRAVDQYAARVGQYNHSMDDDNTSASRKYKKCPSKSNKKLRSAVSSSKSGSKSIADSEGRLSMYSLCAPRPPRTSSTQRDRAGASCKTRSSNVDMNSQDKQEAAKIPKKSPRGRGPLMRAPDGGRVRNTLTKDSEITTMVETIGNLSSHISREGSPRPRSPQPNGVRKVPKLRNLSPKTKLRRYTPKPSQILKALSKIKNDNLESEGSKSNLTPTAKTLPNNDSKERNLEEMVSNIKDKESRSIDNSPRNYKLGSKERRSKESTPRNCRGLKNGQQSAENSPRIHALGRKGDVSDKNETITNRNNDIEVSAVKENTSKQAEMDINTGLTKNSPKTSEARDGVKSEKSKTSTGAASCNVTKLLHQLCSGDTAVSGGKSDRVSGAKNAQLVCVSSGSPRQPTTPQLLRILEETIQKKCPKPSPSPRGCADSARHRLACGAPEPAARRLLAYRTRFVQHMLASHMYANNTLAKPWEMITRISEKIIDEALSTCVNEMQLQDVTQQLYYSETA